MVGKKNQSQKGDGVDVSGVFEERPSVSHEAGGEGAWKLIPELPTNDEILASAYDIGDMPHNPIDAPWGSKEVYLKTQYELLRREGIECLRHAVSHFKARPERRDDDEVCVYRRVYAVGYLMSRLGPICRVSFSVENATRRIQWQLSRRLTPGTIVAVSTASDNFRTICKIATVAQRPYRDGLDQNPPLVDIIWARPKEAVLDPDTELVMIEARSGYFEAVRHTLVGLQATAQHKSPIDKYIVHGDTSDASAAFVQKDPVMSIQSVVSDHEDTVTDWSKIREHNMLTEDLVGKLSKITTMDSSQIRALHRIVTKELAIVQGPPGTGKTFTSISSLRVMLDRRRPGDPPIIVAAQTNHALDQLLLYLLACETPIVRIGGRTENEAISEHSLYNLRTRSSRPVDPKFRFLEKRRRENITKVEKLAVDGGFHEALLDPAALLSADVISEAQYKSLINDDMEQAEQDAVNGPFSLWLGDECVSTEVVRQTQNGTDWLSGSDSEVEDDAVEVDGELDNIADDEEDLDRIRGTFISLNRKWSGKQPSHLSRPMLRAARELDHNDDLFNIPRGLRGAVYQLLIARFIERIQPKFSDLLVECTDICLKLKANRWRTDAQLITQDRCMAVVGCTTTGLSKYRGLLAALQPRSMLIEEAAETREANVTAAIYPSIQQLILVGDHQQLAPHCDVRWLGQAPFNLNVSLFQRLVGLDIPFVMLSQQRRMVPDIRHVLSPFYPQLTDHPLVCDIKNRPPVPGIGQSTWMFTHDWLEETDSNHSKINRQEATMIVGFFAYLVANGLKPSQITVLTFYNGQRKVLLHMLRRHPALVADSHNVFTVDSYQGEENDVVLLSLVRSPGGMPAVGFLEDQNRAVVAISRARRGFYLFGNMENALRASSESFELWGRVWNGFAEKGRVRQQQGIPIICQKHGNLTWIKNIDDWADNAGGCNVKCGETRPCGHRCLLKCHVANHENLGCSEPCRIVMECGHICANLCGQGCNCDCGFVDRKTERLARAAETEAHLHMNLEDILLAESGLAPPAPVPGAAAVTNAARRSPAKIVARGRNGIGNGIRNLGGKSTPQSRGQIGGRDSSTTHPQHHSSRSNNRVGAAKYTDFARNATEHDRQDEQRRQQIRREQERQSFSSSTKETGPGNAAGISETYKPTKMVDGKRSMVVRPRVVSASTATAAGGDGTSQGDNGDEGWLIQL